jgi:hypothetical protein
MARSRRHWKCTLVRRSKSNKDNRAWVARQNELLSERARLNLANGAYDILYNYGDKISYDIE